MTQADTPLQAARVTNAIAAEGLTVTVDHESIQVGSTATFTAKYGNEARACTWEFAPAGVISASGDGPNTNLVVTGVKPGSVTATATWTDPTPNANPATREGTKKLTVAAAKASTVNFSILGAGLGSSALAILAISGAIALSFRGVFSAEIGTLLGTALGAGAAGAVSATHSSNNSGQGGNSPPSGSAPQS